MSMVEKKFLLKCPICRKKIWFEGALVHKNAKHPSVTDQDFEATLMAAIQAGDIEVKRFEAESSDTYSSTQRVARERRYSKLGVRSVVSGGKAK